MSSLSFLSGPADSDIGRKGKKWKHEDASEMMFDDLIKQNEIQISKQDADFIKALIAGEPNRPGYEEFSPIHRVIG